MNNFLLKNLFLAAVVCSVIVTLPNRLFAQPKIYYGDAASNSIGRANLDGTSAGGIVTSVSIPYAVSVDTTNNKVYWVDQSLGTLERADLDGGNHETLVQDLQAPEGVVVVPSKGVVYFSQGANIRTIDQVNLDGTKRSTIANQVATNSSFRDLAVDTVAGKIYWTDSGSPKVLRADLTDTSVAETIVDRSVRGGNGGVITSIALDVAENHLYYNTSAAVYRVNLDGTNEAQILTFTAVGQGLTLDTKRNKIYVALQDSLHGALKAALDGSLQEYLLPGVIAYGIGIDPDNRVLTPNTPIEEAPQTEVTVRSVRITMEKFSSASMGTSSATQSARADGATKKNKITPVYQTSTGRSSDLNNNPVSDVMRRRKTKRNVMVIKNLTPGNYTTSYRVLLTKPGKKRARIVGKTGWSPSAEFTVNQ